MYPKDWPKCPACDAPALDGHITCGKLECDERAARIIREQYGPPKVHILIEGRALCGKPGVPGDWRDGHRWVRFEERATATCDECLSAAWPRVVAERVPIEGEPVLDGTFPDDHTNERKDARPEGRKDEVAEAPAWLLREHADELLRALFAWRDQASSVTRWTTKPSRKLAHLADQLARLYPDATAEPRRAGRFDAIEASMKRIQSLQTPKGRALELLRIREELATMGNDVEAIAEHAADAAEEEETDERQRRREAMAGMKAGGIPSDALKEAIEADYAISDSRDGAVRFCRKPDGSMTIRAVNIDEDDMLRTIEIPVPSAAVAKLAAYLHRKDGRPDGRKDEGTVVQSLHSAGDVLLARFLLANPKKLPSTTTVLELMEWSNAQPPVPLLGNPLPRTRELLRRFADDWRESEKDPANGGGKINVDLLTEVCDAFEAEDRGE